MSIGLMTAIWDNNDPNLSGSKLAVLLCLADRANQDNVCWPSVADIARRSRMSTRNAVYVLRQLEEDGYLTIQQVSGKANHYLISAQPKTPAIACSSEADCTPASDSMGGVQPIAGAPLQPVAVKSSSESSENSNIAGVIAPETSEAAKKVLATAAVVQQAWNEVEAAPHPMNGKSASPVSARTVRERKVTDQQAMVGAVAEVCQLDTRVRANAATCGKIAAQLVTAGYGPEHVRNFGAWWITDKFRREHMTPPNPWRHLLPMISQGAGFHPPGSPNGNASGDQETEVERRLREARGSGGVREA